MFDHSQEANTVDVFVTLTDGRELFGSIVCGMTVNLAKALNGESQFIELHDHEGDATFIGKHQVATLEKAKQGRRKESTLPASALERSNWHEVLGVSLSSNADQVKAAYHALAKQYHPDLFSGNFPAEMRQYATERFSQINKAYQAFLAVKMAA